MTDTEDKGGGGGRESIPAWGGGSCLIQRKHMQTEWITGLFSDSDETPAKGHEKDSCLDNV